MGGGPGWNQAWRGPLRAGLDLIRDAAARFYEDAAGELLVDPWGARDAYGAVVDDPVPVRDQALVPFARHALVAGGEAARERARLLLELQRATLLMYASCAWFFDDIAGLEASLVIRIGAHALDLIRQAGGAPPVREVLATLAEGKSNRPEAGTGADVYRRVAAHQVTATHAVAGAALEALVAPQAFDAEVVAGFDVTLSGHLEEQAPGVRRFEGSARARQRRLGTTEELPFLVASRPGGRFEARVGARRLALDDLGDEARGTLVVATLPSLLPEVGSLVVAAAREVPPNGDTPAGVARRSLLARVVLTLLGDGPAPGVEALGLCGELWELIALPLGSAERRAIEERIWTLLAHGRAAAPLRALAEKVGFARTEKTGDTPAS
jgi:hypothetical protein